MTSDEPTCKSCGQPWRDHAGCESLCAEITRLRSVLDHMRQQAGDDSCAAIAAENARLRAAMPSPQLLRNCASRLEDTGFMGSVAALHAAAERIERLNKERP